MKPTIDQDLEFLESIVRKHKNKAQQRKLYKLITIYTLSLGIGMLTMAVVISQEIRSLDNKIKTLEVMTLKANIPHHQSSQDKLL